MKVDALPNTMDTREQRTEKLLTEEKEEEESYAAVQHINITLVELTVLLIILRTQNSISSAHFRTRIAHTEDEIVVCAKLR